MSQPPSYGSMPPPPAGYPDGGSAPAAPPTNVQRAATCLYGLAGLQVVGLLLSIFTTDSARDAIRETDPSLTESEVSTLVTVGLVVSALVSLAFAGLFVLCARKVLAGRNWARITATVLTGLLVLLGALGLAGGALVGGAESITVVLTVISVALAFAFLVLAWTRPANSFFAAAGARR